MASKFPESEPSLDFDPFTIAELSIRNTFDILFRKLVERGDQLLVELHDLKDSYLSKEVTRKKNIKDLDQLICKLEEATIEQNLITKKQEEHIETMKRNKEEFELPTPVPVPQFVTSHLEELQHQIETFGAIDTPYNIIRHPTRSMSKKGKGKAELRGVELNVKGKGKAESRGVKSNVKGKGKVESRGVKSTVKGRGVARHNSIDIFRPSINQTKLPQTKRPQSTSALYPEDSEPLIVRDLAPPKKVGVKLNDKVLVEFKAGDKVAKVRYIGDFHLALTNEIWVGLELTEPTGKNNGRVDGIFYFKCKDKHGSIVPLSKVLKVLGKDSSEDILY